MLTDEELQAFKAKHGPVLVVEAPDGREMVFRKPTRAEYDSWFDGANTQAVRRQYATDCLLHPKREEFMSILDAFPDVLAGDGGVVAGINIDLVGRGKAKRRVVA